MAALISAVGVSLGLPTAHSGRQQCFWDALAADRGSRPVKREHTGRTSIHRRLLAYEATWRQRIHASRCGAERFRVLTITSRAERLEHIRESCRTLESGLGLYTFNYAPSLAIAGDVLYNSWPTPREVNETLCARSWVSDHTIPPLLHHV